MRTGRHGNRMATPSFGLPNRIIRVLRSTKFRLLRRLGDAVARRRSRTGNGRYRTPQRRQCDSVAAVIDQSPFSGAIVTKPIVLDLALLLPGSNKRRRRGLSCWNGAVGFDQKQFAFPESEKRFRTLRIGASAQHNFRFFLCVEQRLAMQLLLAGHLGSALRLPLGTRPFKRHSLKNSPFKEVRQRIAA